MHTIVSIEKVLKKIPRGRIFFVDSIYKKYPIKLVQGVLLRLAKNNEVGTILEFSRNASSCSSSHSNKSSIEHNVILSYS